MTTLNLTQHAATPEQRAAGVIDLPEADRKNLQTLLTFDTIPTREEIVIRAEAIATLASFHQSPDDRDEDSDGGFADAAMIGGAPYLMAPLERALMDVGLVPLYAFSVRESVEQTQPDGTVKKVAVFRHAGFVGAC